MTSPVVWASTPAGRSATTKLTRESRSLGAPAATHWAAAVAATVLTVDDVTVSVEVGVGEVVAARSVCVTVGGVTLASRWFQAASWFLRFSMRVGSPLARAALTWSTIHLALTGQEMNWLPVESSAEI